jgi:hypothetical protein
VARNSQDVNVLFNQLNMEYPKNLEFIRENGNMGSDGTETDDSKEDGYQ